MKKARFLTALVCTVTLLSVYGCGSKPESANSGEAINHAKTLDSAEAQAKYLIKEAKAFVSSDQFDEAIKTAKYVASNFEESATEAQKIIEQASTELKAQAEKKMEEMKGKLGAIGQ